MRHQYLIGAAIAALVIPAAVSAQETTSQIRGTVTNNGEPVAGAQVTITNVPSGTVSTTTTDESGGFLASGLRSGGPYSVEIQSTAGSTEVTDIFTVIGQVYSLPVDLADNAGPEIIVSASSIRGAGTTSDGPQTVLSRSDIAKVATVNRDIRDLARRSPFARIEDTAGGGRSISFAGINPRFNRFSIDGVVVSDNFGLNPDANPTRRGPVPIDAISQFSVSVAPYDIRQGNFTGGAIDSVLLSGTNEFALTGFYSQNTSGLSGNRIGDAPPVPLDYVSESYGGTLSGPLIKDKLFFMVSAERTTQGNPISGGIGAEGAGNSIPGLTRASVTAVQTAASSVYNYDAGDILTSSPDIDEKIVGKIDWNVTDGHRLSISYINAYDTNLIAGNTSNNSNSASLGLASNGYGGSELLKAGIAQLNSEWSDVFSTEARFLYKSYARTRPPIGAPLAQIRACTDATNNVQATATATTDTAFTCGTGNPNLVFGVENSSQANEFYTDTYGGSILSRINVNNHDLKILAEYNEVRIFNVFFQNTLGNYYFDSIADLNARTANELIYANALSGDQNDTAANFKYAQWTFAVQDDWRLTDRLNVALGARFDLFGQRSAPALNQSFLLRQGFPNNSTYKGRSVFQPRIGFDWEPIDDVKLRGGYGIFAGGSPDVYLANGFQNSGVGNNSITVRRTAPNTFTVNGATLSPTIGAALLDGVTGQVPAAAQALLVSSVASPTPTASSNLSNVNALDPDFDIPSVAKATLSVDWTPRNLLGGGWRFGLDYYYSNTVNQVYFTEIRSVPLATPLPDGRTRYGPQIGTNTNVDILLTNTSLGRSHIGVVRVDKTFDFGLSANFSYTRQDVRDATPATSSTAGSNYGNGAFVDGRGAAYGIANDQVKWAFKYGLGFDRAFFGNAHTRIQLFGETQAGRPFSYTMEDAGSAVRSTVFGVTGRDDRFLLYVPTTGTDPIVSYDSAATQASLENLISSTALRNFRGRIAPRNLGRSRAYTRLDLHLEQEVPTFLGKSKVSVFADIENLPNLLNRNWGGFRQVVFPYVEDIIRVQCLTTAVPTGTAPTAAQINTNSGQTCAQYRYLGFTPPNDSTVETRPSLYLIRLGARVTF